MDSPTSGVNAGTLAARDRVSEREGGAGDGIRTRDILLGKQTLCQLSYSRAGPILASPLARATPASNAWALPCVFLAA